MRYECKSDQEGQFYPHEQQTPPRPYDRVTEKVLICPLGIVFRILSCQAADWNYTNPTGRSGMQHGYKNAREAHLPTRGPPTRTRGCPEIGEGHIIAVGYYFSNIFRPSCRYVLYESTCANGDAIRVQLRSGGAPPQSVIWARWSPP